MRASHLNISQRNKYSIGNTFEARLDISAPKSARVVGGSWLPGEGWDITAARILFRVEANVDKANSWSVVNS